MKFSTKVLLVLSLVILFSMTLTVQADEQPVYEVTADYLNVREKPNANSTIVAVLSKGDQIRKFAEKSGWAKTFYDGEEVWVSMHFLKKVKQEKENDKEKNLDTDKKSKKIKVNVGQINIRSGPGVDHEIIDFSKKGEKFRLVSKKGDWVEVDLGDGKTGWIAGFLMTKPGESKNKSLEDRKIVLDLGHGGKDAGAVGVGGVLEKNLLLDTGLVVADKLKAAGAKVILTREKDHYLTLEERVEISKKHNPDAFVSLHYDSFYDSTVSGTTVFYHRDGELAESMKLALDDDPSIKSRGAKKALYKVLTNTKSPSVLLELGFITNPSELEIIQSESYHKEVAEAIKTGLLKYFD